LDFLGIETLKARYGQHVVLNDISMTVEKGEIVSLIGPSGSGKSSLLRALVGLLPVESGKVRLNGEVINYQDKNAVKRLRDRLAIVFQQYNLFQNMDVLRNVMLAPMKVKGWPREECEREATALLEKVGLGAKLHAYPDQLSGGQQQRVALARALALRPEILLLDEVTSALDPELVNEVLDSVRLLASEGMTMIIVSHEMGFVREVSSRVSMMAAGSIVEIGTPDEIFQNPKNERARDFVGKILRR
jgi:polar amino acid transport system ATP-binding protein